MRLKNYVQGEWVEGTGSGTDLFNAVTGEKFGEASTAGIDFKGVLDYARTVGGPTLRGMTFHERARMLKALAQYLGLGAVCRRRRSCSDFRSGGRKCAARRPISPDSGFAPDLRGQSFWPT